MKVMRFSQLRKLVEQIVADGGGGELDFAASGSGDYDARGTLLSGSPDAVTPQDPSVTNMVYATVTIASGVQCGIDVDGSNTVAFSALNGQQMLQAEVPAGKTYRVYANGVASTIDNIIEVPRR